MYLCIYIYIYAHMNHLFEYIITRCISLQNSRAPQLVQYPGGVLEGPQTGGLGFIMLHDCNGDLCDLELSVGADSTGNSEQV